MSPAPPRHGKLPHRITVIVCIAAGVVAGCMGILASNFYRSVSEYPLAVIGLGWGAITGILAAIIWCRAMARLATPQRRNRLGRIGALLGVGVGMLSTVLLHAGLMFLARGGDEAPVSGGDESLAMPCGLVIAIPLGALVGAVCGLSVRAAGKKDMEGTDPASTQRSASDDSPGPGT